MADRRVVRTVVTKATSTDLTDIEIVKDELNIRDSSSDRKLARYVAEASIAAQQFCNRVFAVETIRDDFWPTRDAVPMVVPGGEEPLQLTTWPIVSVTSVVENDTALTADVDFTVDAEKGQLIRLDSTGYPKKWPAYQITVTYTAGYEEIPADVAGKIVRMVTARYFAAGRDPSLMSESIPGVRDYRVWIPTGTDAGNLPPDVSDVLLNYRVPMIR